MKMWCNIGLYKLSMKKYTKYLNKNYEKQKKFFVMFNTSYFLLFFYIFPLIIYSN